MLKVVRFSSQHLLEVKQLIWDTLQKGELLTNVSALASAIRWRRSQWLRDPSEIPPRRSSDLKERYLNFANRRKLRLVVLAVSCGQHLATMNKFLAYGRDSRPKMVKRAVSVALR